MKIALLGGGGFRTPLAYAALESIAERAHVSEVVLHDVAADRLEHMRLVLDGLAEDSSRRLPVRVTTDLEDAVRGADFVWCAIRVGGLEGRLIDQNVPVREGVVGQETTGPGGICFALRSLPVLLDIARTVARAAPRAWFINFTNPVGLTTEALQQVLGSRAIGVCDTPTGLCRRVAQLLDRGPCQLRFDYFGLNHLGWLRAVLDNNEAGDCLPTLLADADRLSGLHEARLFGVARLRELGMIPNEYLYYYECSASAVDAVRHGRGRAEYLLKQQHAFYAERFATPRQAVSAWRTAWRERERTYMAEAAPQQNAAEPNHPEPTEGYARVAVDLVEALVGNTRRVMILNTANHGSLPFFDARAVVEVPCVVGSHGATPGAVGEVPTEARSLMQQIKHVERLTIKAALEGSAAYAVEALAAHPLVGSMLTAQRIFDGYRAEHAWLRAGFGAG
jgi:6-phospho-beta-glucosidase